MKVYKAINAVQAELSKDGISKDRKNVSQGYNFRGIDDMYNALAGPLARNGLVIMPRAIEREVVERQNKSGGALFYTTIKMEFDFISAEDGSKHTVVMYGEAMDSGDKSSNKAASAAYKYAVMQTFAIPTEGDNDADSATHEVKPKAPPITPTGGLWDELGEDEQKFLQGIADQTMAYLEAGDVAKAVGYLDGQKLTPDEKVPLWSRFPSHHRSAMTKHINAMKKAAT